MFTTFRAMTAKKHLIHGYYYKVLNSDVALVSSGVAVEKLSGEAQWRSSVTLQKLFKGGHNC